MEQARPIPGFDRLVFQSCRIMFSLCILADATWYIGSFDVRSAYFQALGIPDFVIYIVFLAYAFFGLRNLEMTSLGMIITYCAVLLVIHHPVGDGGIGEYSQHMHQEINFMNVLIYIGLIGGLLVIFGATDMIERRKVMQGSKSYAIVLGRAAVSLQFIIQALYFKLFQYRLRTTQIKLMGGSPFFHIFCIGALHLIASYNCWFGNANQRKIASAALAMATGVLAILENATLATSLGLYHMNTEARVHHFIMQVGIATSCCLLYSTAGMNAQLYRVD